MKGFWLKNIVYNITKNRKRKGKLLLKYEEISGGKAHTDRNFFKYFNNYKCLSRSEESKCMWKHGKDGVGTIFTICSHTFTFFWPRKTSVIEIYQISFSVFVCAFPPEISSFFLKSFPFLLPFFVLSYFDTFFSTSL